MKLKEKHKSDPIFVTKPYIAPLEKFTDELESVWDSGILTHHGPKVQRLEREITQVFQLDNFTSTSNGTISLQMAIKALDLKGEIITSAFTWIATVSAIKWENCKPVFCDINPDTLNISTEQIISKISSKTVAIMPVHVFGNPCDIDEIQKIAHEYGLKVIYDAAHGIGSNYKNKSILSYGDISATSLHATKILNSGEGGGCITSNKSLVSKLERIRFFGHNSDSSDIVEDGFNGKMTEIHASLGLANISDIWKILKDRKEKSLFYEELLNDNKSLEFQLVDRDLSNNSYFPIICKNETHLLRVQEELNKNNIFPRRYFYPSANTFHYIVDYEACPLSEDISSRIICLPLYYELDKSKIKYICDIINRIS